ncbi:hypothetical protein [Catalinimonas niigatensis]|uniref:hypothetical protein n=1 Tax=Catalinimonas niigatensis TaxID=1397264 RepID=UPI0026671F9F|nr:hypothetical protein [Catalinimonas niigatensis]WPP51644.1 hypothetical protein PZB72_04490 [Catalinimonas niigatensis]
MHINYNDPVLWLDHRYACDAEARNANIEKKFLAYFNEANSLAIVDAGAGTGSNFQYYFDKLPNHQEWTLLDCEHNVLKSCQEKLMGFAQKHNYRLEENNGLLSIHSGDKKAHIRFAHGGLEEIEQHTDLKKIDVITANALFDLLSYDQFDTFACKLSAYNVCLMATLNYYETSFLPFSEEDGRFIRYFHTHMTRPQAFGAAMGPNCTEEMLDLLAEHQMMVEQEGSQWHLKRYDSTMQHYLLHFFEHAVRDLSLSASEIEDLEVWLEKKKQMCRDHQLEIIVDHSDIFAYP